MDEGYSTPKKMKRVGDLFEGYKTRLKAPQASVEKACVKVIKDVSGYEIGTEQVFYTVSTRTISLRVPSVLKSELRFYYPTILQKLESELGKSGAPKTIL